MKVAKKRVLKRDREKNKREFLERIRATPNRGTGGKVTWTRDELHER